MRECGPDLPLAAERWVGGTGRRASSPSSSCTWWSSVANVNPLRSKQRWQAAGPLTYNSWVEAGGFSMRCPSFSSLNSSSTGTPGYGEPPRVNISHSRTPKDQLQHRLQTIKCETSLQKSSSINLMLICLGYCQYTNIVHTFIHYFTIIFKIGAFVNAVLCKDWSFFSETVFAALSTL